MVVFGRLGGRRGFARGGASCRAKTKCILAEQRKQVTVGGSGIRVKRGMQRRRAELQAKRKDGKKQPEVTRAASSPAYSPVSPTLCPQTGLVLSAAPMKGALSGFLGEVADRCKFIDRECIDGNSTVWGDARPACKGETRRRPGGNRSSAIEGRPPPGGDKPMYKAARVAYPGVVKGNRWHNDHYRGDR